MKLGIVGAGQIVQDLLSFIQEVPNIELHAICATKQEEGKLLELQTNHSIAKVYLDYQELLRDEEVDTIYIALPNHLHYTFSKEALLKGKHVICEKPFTSNLRDFEELSVLAQEQGLILLEAITTQYLKNYLAIKEKIAELGDIKIVECNYSQYSSRYDAFKRGEVLPAFNPKMAGGALMDLNIYNIHFVVGLFGQPKEVQYYANMERGIDTSGILMLDYGTFKCVCIGSKDSKAPVSANIQGDKGCIHLNGPANVCDSFELLPNREAAIAFDEKDHPHRMYDEFVAFERIIRQKDTVKAEAMLANSRSVMQVIEKAKASAGLVFGAEVQAEQN